MFRNPGREIQFNGTIRLAKFPMKTGRAGWVLVGGRSSRMGVDKALLDVGQGALALHAVRLVAEVCETAALVGDPEKYGSLGFPVIPDNVPGFGPLGGIETALSRSAAEWNLIVACDMPLISVEIFERLFSSAPGFDCAVPRHANGLVEPLCAVYARGCHAAVAEALAAGVRRVTDGLRSLAVRYVQTGGEASFANLNTPEDVRKYRNG